MASRRTFTLSSRGFWAITLAFLAIEATLLSLAYRRNTDQRQLAEQVALVRESTTVVWQMAANADIVTAAHFPNSPDIADPRHTWLNSVMQGLRVGGQVHTLNNTITQLVPVGTDDARQTLTDAIVHWGSFLQLDAHAPGSGAAYNELRTLGPTLASLGTQLAEQRDEAGRTVMTLIAIAIGTCVAAFITAGTLLMNQMRRFERSGRMMRSMMNQIGAGVCILGSTNKIADANRAACRMLGRPRRDLRGRRLDEILEYNDGVLTGLRPDGMPLAIERIPGTIEGEKGPLRIVTLLDVTARHLTAECLQHLANHDALTGLPNRGFLEGHFKRELARCKQEGLILGVAALDLDGFKPVNDTYGHAVGDEILVQIAQRLSAALRISDLMARTGGDEFVGIFPDVGNRDSLTFLGERLLGIFNQPFEANGHTITLGGSIGLAIAPDDGTDQDSLLRAADAAMYRAKRNGKRRRHLSAITGPGHVA